MTNGFVETHHMRLPQDIHNLPVGFACVICMGETHVMRLYKKGKYKIISPP